MSENIVSIQAEHQSYSDDDLYNISSWGADLSFREIISMYEEGDLLKPELQRKYVWNKLEASRFVDSILLGLPVPSVFFAKEENETKLIVDGFQRIMTVYDYVNGIFSQDGKIFKLSNSEAINERWRGKSFKELTIEEQRRIRNTTIHAIIFEQKFPRNDTGMYQIFERINTGGRTLKPQEIRNCVYQGKFNDLLFDINTNSSWRKIVGEKEDSRMMDLELILRYFAFKDLYYAENKPTQINLIKYLNCYMGKHQNIDLFYYDKFKNDFIDVIEFLDKYIGTNVFRNLKKNKLEFANKVSPPVFDAVMIATQKFINTKKNSIDLSDKYYQLCNNVDFIEMTTQHTTNVHNIIRRIDLAYMILYGDLLKE